MGARRCGNQGPVKLAAKRDEIETEFRRQDPRIDIGEISLRDGARVR